LISFMLISVVMSANLAKILSHLEEAIEKLKIRYEQYFIGLERFAPIKERKAVQRTIRALRGEVFGNTAQKFKLRMLVQRFTTYQSHWDRIQREIDEGRHRRDLAKIQRDLKKRGVMAKDLLKARSATEVEAALMKYMKEARDLETRQAQEKSVSEVSKPTAAISGADDPSGSSPPPLPLEALVSKTKDAATSPPSTEDSRLRGLYAAYVQAREKTGQPTKGITYEKMVKSINKQLPQIQKKHGSKKVEFCVVVKNGKAILKAVPK